MLSAMIKRLLFLFVSIVLLTPFGCVQAQSARTILDRTAARMTKSGDVKAQFKATQFSGSTPQGESKGTLILSGRKFKMSTDELTSWYDGTTEWTMMTGSDEVNVTTPTEEEQASINPATLVGIYKKGYRFTLAESTLRGRPTFVVYLKAKNKKAIFSDIIVDVDKATYDPLCFRAKKDGDWMRLAVLSFQNGLSLPASTFIFPAKDYPGVEIIDLR